MYDDKIMRVTGLFALHTPECGRTPARSRENYLTTEKRAKNGVHCGGLLHLVQRGGDWAGSGPAQSPPHCTNCNSPAINAQCTKFILSDVAL